VSFTGYGISLQENGGNRLSVAVTTAFYYQGKDSRRLSAARVVKAMARSNVPAASDTAINAVDFAREFLATTGPRPSRRHLSQTERTVH
jgi:hypothetical protein